jgi:alanyl-tRNA synthetase
VTDEHRRNDPVERDAKIESGNQRTLVPTIPMLTGSQIRRMFLDFFIEKGHREVHSSSLVPHNDPTLLFTNAGMNQFKDVFLGLEKRDYSRATSSQKCVRAGGKHNDLENVGFTNRHHTFFEMLGNFSFGDYFKKDAIAFAWELIASEKWFGIPKDKLYVTIFDDPDKAKASWELGFDVERDREAEKYWLEAGVTQERIFPGDRKDNFWQMGDTGPCGPCSEIHYDMGPAASDQNHENCKFPCGCGRYVEIWNLVFMQYDRQPGFTKELPKPSIDTGAGLERLAAVMLNKNNSMIVSNYETDLFVPLIEQAEIVTGARYYKEVADQLLLGEELHRHNSSFHVIADHSRAATFLVSDGVIPSNEGRGYVLRKIIRRAITHGRLLGQTKPFLHLMVSKVVNMMARPIQTAPYRELLESSERVEKIIYEEEKRFAHTLGIGMAYLEDIISEVKTRHPRFLEYFDQKRFQNQVPNLLYSMLTSVITRPDIQELATTTIAMEIRQRAPYLTESQSECIAEDAKRICALSGGEAFKLYDTYGMPRDFMQDAARDQGIVFDQAGFDRAMEEQKSRARASWKGAAKQTANPAYQLLPKSEFEGYRQTRSENCAVLAIIKNGQGVQELKAGEQGEIILDHTPFYAESGGQVGDRGVLYSDELNAVVAEVTGCYYPVQGVRAHQVIVKSPLSAKNAEGWGNRGIRVGDKVDAVVDTGIRQATMRNHTATHLLQAGLREVLGKHVKQAGSLVAPNHLRFDFSHFTSVADEELQDIEDLINKEVLHNQKVEVIENVPIDVAVNEYHAMALFGEKYGDKVRVINIGDFSTELCGGTHTGATGEIGLIKILKEGSVSSGVRRVEAITGEGSLLHFRKDHQLENVVSSLVGPTLAAKNAAKGGATSRKDGAHEPGEASVSPAEALKAELEKKDAEIKRLVRELDQARMKSASSSTANIGEKIKDVKGIKVLAHRVDNLERAQMRTLVDQLRDKIGSGVVVLGSAADGNVSLIVGVTKDLTSRVQAGKVIAPVAQKVGGKGGGRPDLAEAGGKDAGALDAALNEAYSVVNSLLG